MTRLDARRNAIAALWKARFHGELQADADIAAAEAMLIDSGISLCTIDAVTLVEAEKRVVDRRPPTGRETGGSD